MADTERTTQGSLGTQVGGIVLAAVSLACFVVGFYFHGKPEAWGGRETGLMVAAALCGILAAVLAAKPLQAALSPVEGAGETPAWQPAVGLSALVLGGGCLVFVLANRVVTTAWGKADTVVLVCGLVGLVIAAAIWWDPIQRGLSARGTMLQINAGVMTLAVLGILFLINYWIIPRHFGNIKADLTAKKYYSLSDQTKNVAKKVTKDNPIEIIGIMSQGQYSAQQDVFTFQKRLDDYGRLSPYIETGKPLDPTINLEAKKLVEDGTLLGTTGPGGLQVKGVVVRYKNDPDNAEGVNGTEEADITKAILKIMEPSSKKVYFVVGRGEVTPLGEGEAAQLQYFKQLMENDRFELAELQLYSTEDVPADAAVVVVAGPKEPYGEQDRAKLQRYLAKGGRMLMMLDPVSRTDLAELAAEYGIQFHAGVATDPVQAMFGQGQVVASTTFGDHPSVSYFKNGFTAGFFEAGFLTKPDDLGGATVTELIKTSADAYAQQPPAAGAAPGTEPERTNGPLTFAMASTKPSANSPKPEAEKPEEEKPDEAKDEEESTKDETRLVVISDGDFLVDDWAQRGAANSPMAADMVAWLADRTEVLGIPAKDPAEDMQSKAINLTDAQRKWMVVLTLLMPMVLVIVAGTVVKFARR